MLDKIKERIAEAKAFTTNSLDEVEAFRIKYLGKKGLFNEFFAEFNLSGKGDYKIVTFAYDPHNSNTGVDTLSFTQ